MRFVTKVTQVPGGEVRLTGYQKNTAMRGVYELVIGELEKATVASIGGGAE